MAINPFLRIEQHGFYDPERHNVEMSIVRLSDNTVLTKQWWVKFTLEADDSSVADAFIHTEARADTYFDALDQALGRFLAQLTDASFA